MATTNFKGQPVKLIGEFIQVGKVAPDFELVKTDLSSFSLKDLNGKNVILNIFPSLDTSVCATSVRKFNKMAAGLKDTVVLAISKDLPFAHSRFCTTEVHVKVSAPPFLYPCYFGTDIPSSDQLIASGRTIEQIRQIIGADSLAYLNIERLKELSEGLPICTACFMGKYPVDPPTEDIRGEYTK
mgnify:CR=1 FL=1